LVGLSDHSMGIAASVAAVAVGAVVIEKHFTMTRDRPGTDSFFSIEPDELKTLVDSVGAVQKALGEVSPDFLENESSSRVLRPSLFVVCNIGKGEEFTSENIKSIRPGYGLPPKYIKDIVGKKASQDIERGTPLSFELIQ